MNVVLHVHPRTASTSLFKYIEVRGDAPEGNLSHVHFLVNRRHKWHSATSRARIERIGKENWKVITIIRDPVAINLSRFWRWSARHVTRDGLVYYDEAKKFYMDTIDHHSPINFFGGEFEAYWNVNILDQAWQDPYRIYDERFLVLKFECIDAWPKAIEEFLGIRYGGHFPHVNGPSQKLIDLKFSDAYLRRLYRSKVMENFYREDQINELTMKHGGKPYRRVDGSKHVTVLKPAKVEGEGRGIGKRPVRVLQDEGTLAEDGTKIDATVSIHGPHGIQPHEKEA
jgi:hypothetical protein